MAESCCHECQPTAATPAPPKSRARAIRLIVSATAIAGGAGAAWLGLGGSSLAAYAVAVVLSGIEPASRAMRSIRARVLDINVLMVVAVVGAVALGDWFEAAAVVWLFG